MIDFFHRPEDIDNLEGFWGKRTAAVDWCEPNYTHTYAIAEFFNTISSVPAAFLALHALYLTFKYGRDNRFIIVNVMIGMVGIGSAAFHGTLLYTGQIMDELPMIYASLSLLYTVLEMEAIEKPRYKWLSPVLLAFALTFTGVYLYLPEFFFFFVGMYILCILALVYNCIIIYRKPDTVFHQKIFIIVAPSCYIGGWLFFWIPEVLWCGTLKPYNFHALWHVTSTIGGFVMVLFVTYQRELHQGRRPQLNYNTLAGIKLLPYVHVPSAKELAVMDREEMEKEKAKSGVDENETEIKKLEMRRTKKKLSSVR